MKSNLKLLAIPICLLFGTVSPSSIKADPVPVASANELPKNMDARSQQLVDRLHEIKAVDMSTLSREEKKELRKEVRSIKKELQAAKNGIYLSFAAIIIILLLLILILK
jgi:hypothetical protein